MFMRIALVSGPGSIRRPNLTFEASLQGESFVVEIADDGAGIDWQKLAEEARRRGLVTDTQEDLVEVLFADGLSTRRSANEISGRGIGMGAVRGTCEALGGRVEVDSVRGEGTRVRCVFPRSNLHVGSLALPIARAASGAYPVRRTAMIA